MKKIFFLFFVFCFLFFVPCSLSYVHPVFASYVLPYPSFMPGNKLYSVSRVIDQVNNWWFFGSIAKVKYHLGLSDKYLVEAKTLFEYKQYLLGVDALKRSTMQFQILPFYVKQGISEDKNMDIFISAISESAEVHKTVLEEMKNTCPETFQWIPEKDSPTHLPLWSEIENAIGSVTSVVNELK